MLLSEKTEYVKLMIGLFEEYDRSPKESVLNNWFNSLSDISLDDFSQAVMGYIKNEKFPPRLAGVREYLPGIVTISADEAWAHVPKTPYESAWVSQRMMRALGVASELLENGDTIAARKAFIDTYNNQTEEGKWWWTQPEGIAWENKQSKKLEDYSKVAGRKWLKNDKQELLMIENGSEKMLTDSNKKQVAKLRSITNEIAASSRINTGEGE